MAPDELDLAGFAVGVVEQGTQLGPERVRAGDAVVGLPSPGLRSNGYTLARHVLLERAGLDLGDPAWDGADHSVADELLRPSVIYTPAVLAVRAAAGRRAATPCAHITGGGIVGNLPRVAPGRPRRGARPVDLGRAAGVRRDPAPGRGRRGRNGPGLQPWRRHGAGRRRRPVGAALDALDAAGQTADGHRRGRGGCPGRALPVSDDRRQTFAELRDHLLGALGQAGDFTLKSGRKSSWFIDSKQTVCRPEAMLLVADAVLSVLPPEATAIGGLTMGADPVAFVTAGVAATRGRPLKAFSVRKEAKDHGGGGRIAGALDPGDKVVVTEDTVTRGTSLLEAAHAVQEAGAEVVLLVAVVDRGGTVEAMAAAEGIPFRAVLTAPDLGFPYEGA